VRREVYTGFWWGNRPFGRMKLRWEYNIKVDFQEVGWGDMDWSYLAADTDRWLALANAVINLQISKNAGFS
jgi:hypothetical protein